MQRLRPFVLCVLDGWGLRDETEGNAVALAHAPNVKSWMQNYPFTTLAASETAVGLPPGQIGNSEVGHLNIGAGLVVYQDSTRIGEAIAQGSFFEEPVLLQACRHAQTNGSRLHLFGLLGSGGVHAYSAHLYALMQLAKQQGINEVYIHSFLDGRDTPPQSAYGFMQELLAQIEQQGIGQVATVSGRYYAMDRDKRWERTGKAYVALARAEGETAPDPLTAIQQSYDKGVNDEFVLPTVIERDGKPVATVQDNDAVIFYNFRGDRPRQLTRMFTFPEFPEWDRGPQIGNLYYATMTQYEAGLPVQVVYPPQNLAYPLARVLSEGGLRQFHTAETEKYAHVTFFLNGGREAPFEGEDRHLEPSPKVATYDLQPEMSALPLADKVLETIHGDQHDVYIINFANPDMVGHTGSLEAATSAVETADASIGLIAREVLKRGGGLLVLADHGNAEMMTDPQTGGPHTAHTTNPVPCILLSPDESPLRHVTLRAGGNLADVAPTVLDVLGLEKAPTMTGESLIVHT